MYKLRTETSEETKPVDTLILDFPASRIGRRSTSVVEATQVPSKLMLLLYKEYHKNKIIYWFLSHSH